MKKVFTLLLSLVMVFGAMSVIPALAAKNVAYPSTQQVNVDGATVEFQMYALKDENNNDTNYVKVRDVAHILNGTAAQFSVGWDGAVNLIPGQSYEGNGSEMSTPFSGERTYTPATAPTNVNSQTVELDAIVLNDDDGGGYTYYKLRDLGTALGFTVDWSAEKGVFIETEAQAPVAKNVYPVTLYALDGRTCEVSSDQVEAYLAVGWYYAPMTVLYAADGRTQVVPTSDVEAHLSFGWYTSLDDMKVTLYSADRRKLAVMPNEVDAYLSVGWYRSADEAATHAVPFDPNSLKLKGVYVSVYKYVPSSIHLRFEEADLAAINLFTYVTYGDYTFTKVKEWPSNTGITSIEYEYQGRDSISSKISGNHGDGYIYFTANGVRYKLSFVNTGSDSLDFTYSITKLG